MQLPLTLAVTMIAYLQLLKSPALKLWSEPCPLCGAEGCAQFLCFYVRSSLDFVMTVAEELSSHAEIVYRATDILISMYDTDFNSTTTARFKSDLHHGLRYMQRDFLFGTASQLRL